MVANIKNCKQIYHFDILFYLSQDFAERMASQHERDEQTLMYQALRMKEKQLQLITEIHRRQLQNYIDRESSLKKQISDLTKKTRKKSSKTNTMSTVIICILVVLVMWLWAGSRVIKSELAEQVLKVEKMSEKILEKEQEFRTMEMNALVTVKESVGAQKIFELEKQQLLTQCELKRKNDKLEQKQDIHEQQLIDLEERQKTKRWNQEQILKCRNQLEKSKINTELEKERMKNQCSMKLRDDTSKVISQLELCKKELRQKKCTLF